MSLLHRDKDKRSLAVITTKKPFVFTVLVDAGHGGKDPGARSASGLEEKMLALSIAKKLADEINRMPNRQAVLSRSSDDFISLHDRLRLAQRANADLLISIHLDFNRNTQATGASVYALSQSGATSMAASKLAQHENGAEFDIAFDPLLDARPTLHSPLIEAARLSTIQEGIRLGDKVLDELEKVTHLHNHHVEQAGFVVLKSPSIPSVLAEVGFISNPNDAARLADLQYQTKIAHALWLGIERYIQRYVVLRR